jgi:hypothetical protein
MEAFKTIKEIVRVNTFLVKISGKVCMHITYTFI